MILFLSKSPVSRVPQFGTSIIYVPELEKRVASPFWPSADASYIFMKFSTSRRATCIAEQRVEAHTDADSLNLACRVYATNTYTLSILELLDLATWFRGVRVASSPIERKENPDSAAESCTLSGKWSDGTSRKRARVKRRQVVRFYVTR